MENTRAFYLIDKCQLTKKERDFLRIHIETLDYLLDSAITEMSVLKDVIDSGRYLDDQMMKVKEVISDICDKEGDKNNIIKRLDKILKELGLQ